MSVEAVVHAPTKSVNGWTNFNELQDLRSSVHLPLLVFFSIFFITHLDDDKDFTIL